MGPILSHLGARCRRFKRTPSERRGRDAAPPGQGGPWRVVFGSGDSPLGAEAMDGQELILAAAAVGSVSLALSACLWALGQRRRWDARTRELSARIRTLEAREGAAQASADAFDSALLAVEDGHALLASGEESLAACAEALGLGPADPQALLNA